MEEFTLLGCHIKADDAVAELNHLVKVYEEVASTLQCEVCHL